MSTEDAARDWAQKNGVELSEAQEFTADLIERVHAAVIPLVRVSGFPQLTETARTLSLSLPVAARLAVTLAADVTSPLTHSPVPAWMSEALDEAAAGIREIFPENYRTGEIVLSLKRALRNNPETDDDSDALSEARPLVEEIIDYVRSERLNPAQDLVDSALSFLETDEVRDAYVRLAGSQDHRRCHTYLAWWRHVGARAMRELLDSESTSRSRRFLPLKRQAARALCQAGADIAAICYATNSNRVTVLGWLEDETVIDSEI